jgi:RNA polymerase sigma factor (TIGR02999 family)
MPGDDAGVGARCGGIDATPWTVGVSAAEGSADHWFRWRSTDLIAFAADDAMNLTDLINRRSSVEKPELEALAAALWPTLERLAAYQLQGRSGLTLQASDLAQDAYISLMHEFPGRFNNREHFYALAARIVRNIVVDYLRRRSAEKRGSGLPFERLEKVENEAAAPLDDTVNWIAVDAALTILSDRHEAAAQVVELKFFAGLTNEQIADAMGLSRATVIRHYRYARAWLIDHFDVEPGTDD